LIRRFTGPAPALASADGNSNTGTSLARLRHDFRSLLAASDTLTMVAAGSVASSSTARSSLSMLRVSNSQPRTSAAAGGAFALPGASAAEYSMTRRCGPSMMRSVGALPAVAVASLLPLWIGSASRRWPAVSGRVCGCVAALIRA
jgi:hypothetical protein